MKKKWMFLIAELAAMIILAVINKIQYRERDRKLPHGSKVRMIKGLPVLNFGWFRKTKGVEEPPMVEPDPYVWTPEKKECYNRPEGPEDNL